MGLRSAEKPTVVVTGVSSGIGKSVTEVLTANGYVVFGSVRKKEDGSSLQKEFGAGFKPLVFDIRQPTDVRIAADYVSKHLAGRPLSGLVNNAGLALFGPMECLDDQLFEDIIAVNLLGARNVTNAFIPLLRGTPNARPGKIINMSSLSGILNTPMNGAYCVSKHALESLGEIYRRELLPAGIDVVSIRSGPIRSEIWTKAKKTNEVYSDATYQKMASKSRKIMQNAELKALPARLVSDTVHDILEGRKCRSAYHLSEGAWISRVLSAIPNRIADSLITRTLMKSK